MAERISTGIRNRRKVEQATRDGILLDARELVYLVAVAAHRVEEVAELMKGQYRLALERGYYTWVKEFRVRLDHIMDKRDIEHYFPSPDGSRRQAGDRPYLPRHSRLHVAIARDRRPQIDRKKRGNSRRSRNWRAGTPMTSGRATPDRTPAYPQSPRRGQAAHRPSRGNSRRGRNADSPAPGSYDRFTAPGRSPRGKRRSATPDLRRDPQEARLGRAAHQGRRVSSMNGMEMKIFIRSRPERGEPLDTGLPASTAPSVRRGTEIWGYIYSAHTSQPAFTTGLLTLPSVGWKPWKTSPVVYWDGGAMLSDLVQEYDLVSRVSDGHVVEESVVLQDIRQVARELGEDTPDVVTLMPLSCTAGLAHWMVLAQLLRKLSAGERDQFRKFRYVSSTATSAEETQPKAPYSAPASSAVSSVEHAVVDTDEDMEGIEEESGSSSEAERSVARTRTASPAAVVEAIDSHCHLDRLGRAGAPDSDAVVAGISSSLPVRIKAGVAVFCDPDSFPHHSGCIPANWRMAVGIHPKKATKVRESDMKRLQELTEETDVALGEIGLDRTVGRSEWHQQEELLINIVSKQVNVEQVLVLHMRGEPSDWYGTAVSQRCRSVIAGYRGSLQPIHLHCFTGTVAEVERWSAKFEREYFGFTALVESFDVEQKDAMRAIPLDRLLLETDSPHLPPRGHRRNNPALLGEVASTVADVLGRGTDFILKTATENAARLYRIR